MIYQAPIELKVEGRKVVAVLDFDTGFLGFTELVDRAEVDYYFGGSPVEFKKALFERLEPIFGHTITTNFKISRKSEKMKFVNRYLTDDKM